MSVKTIVADLKDGEQGDYESVLNKLGFFVQNQSLQVLFLSASLSQMSSREMCNDLSRDLCKLEVDICRQWFVYFQMHIIC